MIWPVLRAGIYWTIGAVQTGAELFSAGRKLVRQARKGLLPSVDDTDPFPLTHKDSERIAEFGRRAGHEIPKAPRVPKI